MLLGPLAEHQTVPIDTKRPVRTAGRSIVVLQCMDVVPSPRIELTEDIL